MCSALKNFFFHFTRNSFYLERISLCKPTKIFGVAPLSTGRELDDIYQERKKENNKPKLAVLTIRGQVVAEVLTVDDVTRSDKSTALHLT